MIRVTKFDGKTILLNADWIQTVEQTPDTLITLTTGFQLMVKDPIEEVLKSFLDYRRESKFSGQTPPKENV